MILFAFLLVLASYVHTLYHHFAHFVMAFHCSWISPLHLFLFILNPIMAITSFLIHKNPFKTFVKVLAKTHFPPSFKYKPWSVRWISVVLLLLKNKYQFGRHNLNWDLIFLLRCTIFWHTNDEIKIPLTWWFLQKFPNCIMPLVICSANNSLFLTSLDPACIIATPRYSRV